MSGRDEGLEQVGLGAPADETSGELRAEDAGLAAVAPSEAAPRAPLFDRLLDRPIAWYRALEGWLPLALAIAASPGLLLWPLLFGDTGYLLDNAFPLEVRKNAGACVAGSVALVGAAYVVAALRAAGRRVEALRRMNERVLPLLALPAIPFLLHAGVERTRPWIVLLLALCIATLVGIWAYRRPIAAGGKLPAALPAVIAGIATAAWTVRIAILAIAQHHGLETSVYDLGIYDSIFWHSIHGEPLASDLVRGGNHISAHFDPLLVLLSPLYLIYPRAESILVLQAVWVGAGAIPVWLLARHRLGPWYALGFVVLYLLLPSVHGRTLYHFHSLTLAGPLILWCMACLELGWLRRYWAGLVLLLLTREDMPLVACMLGAFAVLDRGHRKTGVVTIAVAAVYLIFAKFVVMAQPGLLTDSSPGSYGYAYYYKDLIPNPELGASGLLVSLVTNPVYALLHVVTEPKLRFFALLFAPVLLLPLVAPRGRILMLYGFAFLFLASRSAVYSVAFQYATVLEPFVLGLAIVTLADLQHARLPALRRLDPHRARPALLAAMLACTCVISWKFGAFVPNEAFRAGFHKLVGERSPELRAAYEWVRKAAERIGPTASVSASDRLAPHVTNRASAFQWPTVNDADFLLLERKGMKVEQRRQLSRLTGEGKYRVIDEFEDRFVLLERVREGAAAAEDGAAPAGVPVLPGGVQKGQIRRSFDLPKVAPRIDRDAPAPALTPRRALRGKADGEREPAEGS